MCMPSLITPFLKTVPRIFFWCCLSLFLFLNGIKSDLLIKCHRGFFLRIFRTKKRYLTIFFWPVKVIGLLKKDFTPNLYLWFFFLPEIKKKTTKIYLFYVQVQLAFNFLIAVIHPIFPFNFV